MTVGNRCWVCEGCELVLVRHANAIFVDSFRWVKYGAIAPRRTHKYGVAPYAWSFSPPISRRFRAGQSCANGPRSNNSGKTASFGAVYARVSSVRESSTLGEGRDGGTWAGKTAWWQLKAMAKVRRVLYVYM